MSVPKELPFDDMRVMLQNGKIILNPMRYAFTLVGCNVSHNVHRLVVVDGNLQLLLQPREHSTHVQVVVGNPKIKTSTIVHVEHNEAGVVVHPAVEAVLEEGAVILLWDPILPLLQQLSVEPLG